MGSQPLVSLIVPVYGAERFLPYCLDSLIGQSYQNLEILLIDDGSPDNSGEICDAYAAHDARITVFHEENGGIAKAQNTGLDHAHGDLIAFSDNDDILDRRNIEILVDALEQTGADMSKGRWRQFGVSQLDMMREKASAGATNPDRVSVFRHPLSAYQTVFCKSLRLLDDALGFHGEARYFNEANWCRVYRRELWEGIRFPEGMYAQDVMVAGRLYERMHSVVDVDSVLYYWLQSSGSVTHKQRSAGFYHDNAAAGIANFRLCLDDGVTPARSYYTMVGSVAEEHKAARTPQELSVLSDDVSQAKALLHRLTPAQHLICAGKQIIRLAEKQVYDHRVKNMR